MKVKIILITIAAVFLTGCWDNVEINEREYIFAVGIDKGEDDNLIFTAEIPKINEGSEEQRLIYTEESNNFSNFYNDSFVRTDKVISDRLMQVIVLGESVVSDPDTLKEIFDEIERSPQINRRVKLTVAKGDAKDIIKTEIPNNPVVGNFLSRMLIKLKKSMYQDIYTFDEALLNLQDYGNGILPLVEKYEDSLKVESSAVIKDYKHIGNLNYDENEIVMLLLNPDTSNLKNINVNVEDTVVSLGAVNIKITDKIDLRGDKLKVNYYVSLNCYIDSFTLNNKNLADKNFINKIKESATKQIIEQTEKTINKLQKTYKSDVLRIKDNLYKYHRKDFDKIKDNYEQIFQNADINVYYAMDIKSTGLVK